MKKRILASLLSLVMVLSMLPTALAAEDFTPTGGPQQDEAVCICKALCTEEEINTDCPVCGGEAGYMACAYTVAGPQGDGGSTPWTDLTPAEPVDVPARAPVNNDGIYNVSNAEELTAALTKIAESANDEATIVLNGDLKSGDRTATTEEEKELVGGTEPEKQNILGVVGKHITFTSQENERYTLGINWSYLVGDVTFDHINMTKSNDVYANGFLMEFTENFEGNCSGYVYGGSNLRAVDSTHLIFNAGSFGNGGTSYGIYGGGYAGGMGRPTGPSLGLDGEPGMPGWTPPEFKAGTGDVNGDVRVEIGGTANLTYLIGGSRNGNVKGNVHITLQSDSADARTVGWIAGSGYGNQAGYGNVMGDVTIDALSGNVAYITGTGNQGATSDPGIKLGDVDSVAGDVNITVGQDSGTPMCIRASGGGTNLLAGCGKPMTTSTVGVVVCGDVNITLNKTAQLDDGDASTLYYGTVFGVHSNSAVCGSVNIENNGATVRDLIGTADGAQILGNGRDHALKIVMNDGELRNTNSSSSGRGYIRPYKSAYNGGGETLIKNDVIFEVNGGTLWGAEATEKSSNTFTIDGDFTAVITTTTKNGLVTAVGGKVGTELTEGHKSTAVFTGGGNILIDNVINFDEVIVKDNTTARLRAVNDEDGGNKPYPFAKDDGVPAVKDVIIEAGSILALYKEGEITGNLTVNGTLALARQSSGVVAPMTAQGTASGSGSLRPISTSTSLFMKSTPKYLEEYVYAQTADSNMTLSLDSSNNNQYFVDRKASNESGQDVWFINEKPAVQNVTVTFNKNGGDTEASPNTMTVTSGSSVGTLPTAPTRTDYTFKGWNTAADGNGTEFTAATTVTSNITVYAQWERNTTPVDPKEAAYRVEHYQEQPDGSYTIFATEFPLYGEIGATVSAVPKTYEHYHVNNEKSNLTGIVEMPTAGEDGAPEMLTLKVYYDLDTVTVSYDLNGGTGKDGVSYAPETVKQGATVTIKDAPSKSGYTFEGWNDGTTTHQPGAVLTVTSNITLTAQWYKNSSGGGGGGGTTYYILSYEANGGTEYKDERYKKNTVVELDKVPTREGYTFTGWYSDEELTDRIASIKMTSNKTVYAGWEPTGVPDWLNGKDHFAYVVGYSDGTVRPLNNISRAEVATIFFRLLNEDIREDNLTSTNTFADVNEGMWCNTAISTMAKLGVVKGRTAERFDPDAPITRAEFAAICARFDTSKRTGDSDFTDISGHWAEAEIERAASLGWIMGYTDGTFRPENYITRAEAMTMINRVLNRLPEDEDDLLDGMNVWPDNKPGDWYYLAVQEATNSHDFTRKGDVHEHWTKLNADPDWTQYQK